NTGAIEAIIAEPRKDRVQLAVLPEYAYHDSYETVVRSKVGPPLLARDEKCAVVFGAKAEVNGGSFRNVAVVLNSRGSVLGTFTKQRPVPLFRDGIAGTERPVFHMI